MNTAKQKKEFLKAYAETFGNVSQSCNAVDIARGTYYLWLQKDKKFAKEIEDCQPRERFKDYVESKLMQLIRQNNTAAIIFTAKTQLKDRGYVERQEIITNETEIDFRTG